MEAVLGKLGQQNNTLPQAMQRRVGVVGRQAPLSKLKQKHSNPAVRPVPLPVQQSVPSLRNFVAQQFLNTIAQWHTGTVCITPALLVHSTATTQALKATVSLRELRYVASPRCVGIYSFSVLLLQNDGCCIARCAAAHVFVKRFF